MIYLEKVINDRIAELVEQRLKLVNEARKELINGTFDPDVDFNSYDIECTDIFYRLDELNKLKEGLGLVPIEEKDKLYKNQESA